MMASQNEGFIIDATGPSGLAGVFEDDGETGYLYLYETEARNVLRHLHVYDRSPALRLSAADVRVKWNADFGKVGVIICGKMRGIIDLHNSREGRVWMESPKSPGIEDAAWLRGFDLT